MSALTGDALHLAHITWLVAGALWHSRAYHWAFAGACAIGFFEGLR
jgi:hypothetical protein